MLRAFALAVGITLCVAGAECLVVEKAVLASSGSSASASDIAQIGEDVVTGNSEKAIEPPEWAPWTLLSIGAVVIIYCFTIPKRASGG